MINVCCCKINTFTTTYYKYEVTMKINLELNIRLLLFTYIMFTFAIRLFTNFLLFDERMTRIILYSFLFIAAVVELYNFIKCKLKIKKVIGVRNRTLHIFYLTACTLLVCGYIYQLMLNFLY